MTTTTTTTTTLAADDAGNGRSGRDRAAWALASAGESQTAAMRALADAGTLAAVVAAVRRVCRNDGPDTLALAVMTAPALALAALRSLDPVDDADAVADGADRAARAARKRATATLAASRPVDLYGLADDLQRATGDAAPPVHLTARGASFPAPDAAARYTLADLTDAAVASLPTAHRETLAAVADAVRTHDADDCHACGKGRPVSVAGMLTHGRHASGSAEAKRGQRAVMAAVVMVDPDAVLMGLDPVGAPLADAHPRAAGTSRRRHPEARQAPAPVRVRTADGTTIVRMPTDDETAAMRGAWEDRAPLADAPDADAARAAHAATLADRAAREAADAAGDRAPWDDARAARRHAVRADALAARRNAGALPDDADDARHAVRAAIRADRARGYGA